MESDSYRLNRKKVRLYLYRSSLISFGEDLRDCSVSPYTTLKAQIYCEIASLIVYIAFKIGASANQITLVYAICGPTAALLMCSGSKAGILAGSFIFFFKSSLDWADGYVAKHNKTSSVNGHLLDVWGAKVNLVSFQLGLCGYLYITLENALFLIFSSTIFALEGLSIRVNSGAQMPSNGNCSQVQKILRQVIKTLEFFYYSGESRKCDFILLMVLIDFYYGFPPLYCVPAIWTLLSFGKVILSISRLLRARL